MVHNQDQRNLAPETLLTRLTASKDVVSRTALDGSVILMRLDETNFFYKIEGIAAILWAELESPKTARGLIEHFSPLARGHEQQLRADILSFVSELVGKGLAQADAGEAAETSYKRTQELPSPYRFGGLKEFNLEQIEAEVLNNSVYLDVFAGSDLRLKKDIQPIEGALAKVSRLHGITYKWRPETAGARDSATHAGLIAQDVAANMPELVRKDEASGFLAVEYQKMSSYLVEAVKELNVLVARQAEQIKRLEGKLARLTEG